MKTNDLWYFLDKLLKGNRLAMIFHHGTRGRSQNDYKKSSVGVLCVAKGLFKGFMKAQDADAQQEHRRGRHGGNLWPEDVKPNAL